MIQPLAQSAERWRDVDRHEPGAPYRFTPILQSEYRLDPIVEVTHKAGPTNPR